MMKIAAIAVLAGLLLWAGALMPGLYGHLPVSVQIAAYGGRLKVIPFASESARSAIARNESAAADALAEDLARERPRLLPSESARILMIIQHRGTPLKNTAAERALRELLASGRGMPADVVEARFALHAIENDVRLPPELQPR